MSIESLWDWLPAELQEQIYFMRWQAEKAGLRSELEKRVELAVPVKSGTILVREGDHWYRSYKFQFPQIHLVWGLWYLNQPRVAHPLNYVQLGGRVYKNSGYTAVYFDNFVKCDLGAEVKQRWSQ